MMLNEKGYYLTLLLLAIGLWNANLLLSEKGFYGISFALSLFASVAVQKNVRDLSKFNDENPTPGTPEKPRPTARFDNSRPQKPTLGQPDEQP